MPQGRLAAGVAAMGEGAQKAPEANGLKVRCHLLMKTGLKRTVAAIRSMKASHRSTGREAGLRGGLDIFIAMPQPVAVRACKGTAEQLHSAGRSQNFQTIVAVNGTQSIPNNVGNARFVSSSHFNSLL